MKLEIFFNNSEDFKHVSDALNFHLLNIEHFKLRIAKILSFLISNSAILIENLPNII